MSDPSPGGPPPGGPSPGGPSSGDVTVLVVDDEPNIRDLLSQTLRLVGFRVTTAATGFGALTAAESGRPDLVVLDVMLPDLDGFEVAGRLRAAGTDAPVLFLTARDSVDDRIRGLTAGGDGDGGRGRCHPGHRRSGGDLSGGTGGTAAPDRGAGRGLSAGTRGRRAGQGRYAGAPERKGGRVRRAVAGGPSAVGG